MPQDVKRKRNCIVSRISIQNATCVPQLQALYRSEHSSSALTFALNLIAFIELECIQRALHVTMLHGEA